jgi:putative sterol carrier protein
VSADALFSSDWAAALERELAGDDDFRRHAGSWRASLLLVLEADDFHGIREERVLFLDLAHASGHAVRPALPGDDRAARVRVAGPAAAWLDVLGGGLDPSTALMSGRLRLERGSLFSLLPHLEAARRLFAAARRVGIGQSAATELP